MEEKKLTGGFTLPGESGQEALTLELAKRWGADVIRDSDGTSLSDEILNSGYGIYSTICIIRDHNEWAKEHPETLQQTFLSTDPRTAEKDSLSIRLLDDFYEEQFKVNDSEKALAWWQVWDRTANLTVPEKDWSYDASKGTVSVNNATPWHSYTVSFLAYRIWEEISMYNHVTNDWGDREHLMPIDPVYPEVQEYLLSWLDGWCVSHPATTVVRFTSMFYNFVWIWGSDERNRNRFTDWSSYDFTVSPAMLESFEAEYGYRLTAEDFINKGTLNSGHMPPSEHKRDYMDHVNRFVVSFGKKLIDITHRYGKKAYVFYDDTWIGVEPNGSRFKEFGFDGLIKCVFSGFEARLCAEADVPVHELRFHPYLFPVGLGGAPTFAPGGDPARDALEYWLHVRRAMMRVRIDRIGLGGYLHLLPDHPEFITFMEHTACEFRKLLELHKTGAPSSLDISIRVLHSWGSLRPWTLSGHFHETYMHELIHINEALSGLPVNVRFISFEDVLTGDGLEGADVVINAGTGGTAWSGGDVWSDPALVEKLSAWTAEGGVFLGVREPSAIPDGNGGQTFAMKQVLGVDMFRPSLMCHGKWDFDVTEAVSPDGVYVIPAGISFSHKRTFIRLMDKTVSVFAVDDDGTPLITMNSFGKGKGIYLNTFETDPVYNRFLLNLILFAMGMDLEQELLTDNPLTECAYFPESKSLVVVNNSHDPQSTTVHAGGKETALSLEGCEMRFISL